MPYRRNILDVDGKYDQYRTKSLRNHERAAEEVMSNHIGDYRIFGFDRGGQLRVNLYHGADLPSCAGSLYSWTWARTSRHLAHKLETQWEQPLSGAEWETIEELELSFRPFPIVNAFVPPEPGSELLAPFSAYVEQPCDECGGNGHDIGSLNPWEFEPCPSCHGCGKETVLRQYLSEAFAIADWAVEPARRTRAPDCYDPVCSPDR
jgi:hypothetical protein